MTTATSDVFGGLPDIFREACDPVFSRFAKPIERGDFIWATNGRICVRRPLALVLDRHPDWGRESAPGYRIPDLEKAWELSGPWGETGSPIPPLPAKVICDECSGTGNVECNYGHTHDCTPCRGSGSVGNDEEIEVGGVAFSAMVLAPLVQAGVKELRLSANAGRAAYFVGDDFEGIVIPVKAEEYPRS